MSLKRITNEKERVETKQKKADKALLPLLKAKIEDLEKRVAKLEKK